MKTAEQIEKRPVGRPRENLIARMVSMKPMAWQIIDAERGDLPRGRYLASLLFGPIIDPEEIPSPELEEMP